MNYSKVSSNVPLILQRFLTEKNIKNVDRNENIDNKTEEREEEVPESSFSNILDEAAIAKSQTKKRG